VEIAPGVVYMKIRDPKGPWRIHVVDITLAEASTIEPVLATGKLPGFELTSRIARRYGALAAINGDYARESGRPVMLFAQDGALAQTALTWGVNFAVNASETESFIQHVEPRMWLREMDAGLSLDIARFNAGTPAGDQLAGYSPLGGRDEKPPYGACSTRVYPSAGPRSATAQVGIEQPGTVHQVACKGGRLYPKRGNVFSAPIASDSAAAMVSTLTPGEEVAFGWSLEWPDVFETIGGNPTLVRDGEVAPAIRTAEHTSFFDRHPRTGVGTTADGRVMFVTVDGRRPGYSVGMTPVRFAKLFLALGADYALNLDGGGSTTMVVNGGIVNRPSDGNERPVSSALVLLPGPDPAPTTTPAPMPTTSPSVSPNPTPSPTPTSLRLSPDLGAREVWLEIARDPASTGGLAQWLLHEGVRLSPSLRAAARIFGGR
jgi:uncharacterized protein YigE (DUF2233 family)